MKVDEYLRKNLSAEKLAKIERIKAEAIFGERINSRHLRHISERDEQILQKYLNEEQEDQVSGLLYMGRSMGISGDEIGDTLDHYLETILDDETLNKLADEVSLNRHKRI
uniref:Na+/H+ antiporter n=1 Tax=Ascaris lumbricoides TaxID=6252 RepID=A0A0M3ITM7_ASCLU